MSEIDFPLDNIVIGKNLVALDPDNLDVIRELDNGAGGIPVADIDGVSVRDGSALLPIVLPNLQEKPANTSFPLLFFVNGAGVLMALQAPAGAVAQALVGKDGSFQVIPLTPLTCFDGEAICGSETCVPDFVAGFKLNVETGQLCLVKIPLPTDSSDVHFGDSSSVKIAGNGVLGDPFIPSVPISAQAGNTLQLLADGFFVA